MLFGAKVTNSRTENKMKLYYFARKKKSILSVDHGLYVESLTTENYFRAPRLGADDTDEKGGALVGNQSESVARPLQRLCRVIVTIFSIV